MEIGSGRRRASTCGREEWSLPPLPRPLRRARKKTSCHHIDRAGDLLSERELQVPGPWHSDPLPGGVEGGLAGHRILEIQLKAQIMDQMRVK